MNEIFLMPCNLTSLKKNVHEVPPNIEAIGAPQYWENGAQGGDIVVALLDSGCQMDHPDLIDNIIGGRNFTSDYNGDASNFSDNLGHGTHVAGTIAAGLNNFGVVGVAPKSKLLILKVISQVGGGSYADLIAGILYAIKWRGDSGERVRVITMSLGGLRDDKKLHEAIQKAVRNNILVVCASGNSGDNNLNSDEIMYPGYYEEVVEVGSVNIEGEISSFSNSNRQVDLYAPGENILSTYPDNMYSSLSGTSMAVPHVVGAAALIICHLEYVNKRTFTEREIFNELINRNTITKNNAKLLCLKY